MPKYLQKMMRRSESQQSLLDNNIDEFNVEPTSTTYGCKSSTSTTCGCISSRFKIAILSLLACVVLYITRVNLNVAIVSMVNDEPQNSSDHNSSSIPLKSACPSSKSHLFINQETKVQNGQFDWSQSTQGFILGSFYLGYICFQTIGSRFAEIFGAKWICGYGILLSGIINLLTPFIVEYFYIFIASRILLGLVQSAVFPSFYALFVKWYPDDERAKYLPWLDCGTCIGTIVAMGMSGYIIKSKSLGGWPTVFYVSGLFAVIWFILWYITAHSDPRHSQSISKDELNYIITNTEDFSTNTQSVPWIKIFKSKEFLSVLIAKLFLSFTFGLLLTKLPTYLDVINIPIDENGMINSLVNIGYVVTLLTGGILATFIIENTRLSRTKVRKIFEMISGCSMGIFLIGIPLAGCNKDFAIVFFVLVTMMMGLSSGGDIPIVAEMTSEFAATVFSIMNTISSFTGFFAPMLVGFVIDADPYSITLWSYVYYFSAFLCFLGSFIFLFFASAKSQNW